jgi:hypothetical protein
MDLVAPQLRMLLARRTRGDCMAVQSMQLRGAVSRCGVATVASAAPPRLRSHCASSSLSCPSTVLLRPRPTDYRNKLKWLEAAKKNSNSNPRRGGPWHWRAPSRIFWKTVRGMIPHKVQRGAEALARLKVRL